MKSAIKTSEESWIEQQMLEDKKRATDWEATNEAIEEQVARESYLQWLQDQEKQARQVGRTNTLTHTWMHLCAHSCTRMRSNSDLHHWSCSLGRPAPPAVQRRRQPPAVLTTGAAGRHGNGKATPRTPRTSVPPPPPTTSPPPPLAPPSS